MIGSVFSYLQFSWECACSPACSTSVGLVERITCNEIPTHWVDICTHQYCKQQMLGGLTNKALHNHTTDIEQLQ